MEQTLSNRRRYLTADELEKLIKAGRKGRYGRRDALLLAQKLRQLGDIDRDPPRLVFAEQLRCGLSPRLILEIERREYQVR